MPKHQNSSVAVLDQISASRAGGIGPIRRVLLIILGSILLAAFIVIAFGRAVDSPLIFDDKPTILDNSSIQSLWPLIGDAAHRGPLNPPANIPISGRPLVNYTFALNHYFGGDDPRGYHIVNLIIHLLAAILLWRLATRILRLADFARTAEPLGFIVALLWSVHPLQSETVIYVTQRTELMSGFFYIATVYSSLRYLACTTPSRRAAWLVMATLACVLGAASKEIVVTAPIAVLLIQWLYNRDSIARSWPLYIGLCAGWLMILVTQHGGPHSQTAGFHIGIAAHAWWFTQARVLLMYLKLIAWPHPLVIHYANRFDETFSSDWLAIISVIVLAALGAFLLLRKKAPGLAIALTFLILAPTLVVPNSFEVAAERRMYLPLAAILLWLVAVAYRSTRDWRSPITPLLILGVGLAIGWSIVSWHRAGYYQSEQTLWAENLRWQPDDPITQNSLGLAILTGGATQQTLTATANSAQPPDSDLATPIQNQQEQAKQYFEEAIRLDPNYVEAHNNLANLLLSQGNFEDAIHHYRQVLDLHPDLADVRTNLGVALFQAGHMQESIAQFRMALAANPGFANAHNNLAGALLTAGDANAAIDEYLEAIRLQPNYVEAYGNLAQAYAAANRRTEAIATATKGIALARSISEPAAANAIAKWLEDYRAKNPAGAQP